MEKELPKRRALHIEQSPLEKVRLWVEILAFAAAGVWAIYTFVYQTQIAPSFLPAHEVFTVSVQRLASTASGSVQRVQIRIHNDGWVDVDTAALALNVYATAASDVRWQTVAATNSYMLHFPNTKSWTVIQAYGRLLDAATGGQRHNHLLLRPGDSFDLAVLAAVPREDHVVLVEVDTAYDRYPIRANSIAIRLVRKPDGAIVLSGNYPETNFVQYFGV
jgi:hypothetical protein